jgi:ABC-type multidrug transport system ATPase subunit
MKLIALQSVMKGLKQIAESGRTVIVTLHQPRSDIYHLLDNLIVLAKGGRMVYTGPRDTVESTFQLQGHTIPEHFNPADFLLDVVSVDNRPQFEGISEDRVNALVEFWSNYEQKTICASGEEKEESPQEMSLVPQQGEVESRITPIWIAGPVVLERMIRNM